MAHKEHPDLATHITKDARHQLVRLCLTSIRYEYVDMPLTRNKHRGRPPSLENRLAIRLNVFPRTVRRWASGTDAIQSSDINAEKLVEIAYTYNPEETTWTLNVDTERYQRRVEEWLRCMELNSVTCPCPENQGDVNLRPHQSPFKEAHQRRDSSQCSGMPCSKPYTRSPQLWKYLILTHSRPVPLPPRRWKGPHFKW